MMMMMMMTMMMMIKSMVMRDTMGECCTSRVSEQDSPLSFSPVQAFHWPTGVLMQNTVKVLMGLIQIVETVVVILHF